MFPKGRGAGFIPERFTAEACLLYTSFKTAEVKDLKKLHELRKNNPYLDQCRIISNSDAHYLEHINEPELTIGVEEKSIAGVLNALGGGGVRVRPESGGGTGR